MLASLGVMLLGGLGLQAGFEKIKLPGVIGILLAGMILGPYALDLINQETLAVSADLREFALIIILLRAGLSLKLKDLKEVGRPAILLSFLPALFEITGVVIITQLVFSIPLIDSLILGSIVAAVSPAILVPRMLDLMTRKYGTKKRIPQILMIGSSVDDVLVIVLFTFFLNFKLSHQASYLSLITIPLGLIAGIVTGAVVGYILVRIFKKFHMRDTVKTIILLSFCFLYMALQDMINFSGLLAILSMGIAILSLYPVLAERLSQKFSKFWVFAQLVLFILVGAAVDLSYIWSAGLLGVVVILFGLVFRSTGVFACLAKTQLNIKEKSFCAIAYLPKATVQAVIGAIPLTAGLESGPLILAMAVLCILITAPMGAIGIDKTYQKLLEKES